MIGTVGRLQILKDLEHHGISGRDANFIELVPLVEMIWADENTQDGELSVLDDYIDRLVDRLNELNPTANLTVADAEAFAMRFLSDRPSAELLTTLRNFAIQLADDAQRDTLLQACLDIAASSVIEYPYSIDERFNPAEKRTFFEILAAVEAARD